MRGARACVCERLWKGLEGDECVFQHFNDHDDDHANP